MSDLVAIRERLSAFRTERVGDCLLVQGDCLQAMAAMPDGSVDAVVTDPPYGLSFMGKAWDKSAPGVEVWAQVLRVLKPGGHLLAFAGTRTQHRMAGAIEDAGLEILDMIAWVYGSGFPKSLNVGKAIDAAAGEEREVVGQRRGDDITGGAFVKGSVRQAAPATPEAAQWDGWGTALKPALEPLTLARKPLDGTVAANILKHGVGGINVDGCRIKIDIKEALKDKNFRTTQAHNRGVMPLPNQDNRIRIKSDVDNCHELSVRHNALGRFPANLIHDGSEEVLAGFGAGGSAARFFYCAKASKKDREDGLRAFPVKRGACETFNPMKRDGAGELARPMRRNVHPTVKPTDLMRYLCRLITPPGGIVLDPFMGSGSTGRGAALEGFRFIGCELYAEYFAIATARIAKAAATPVQQNMLAEGAL